MMVQETTLCFLDGCFDRILPTPSGPYTSAFKIAPVMPRTGVLS